MAKVDDVNLAGNETAYLRDGKAAMLRNKDPKKYFVIRNRKDNSVKYATNTETDSHFQKLKESTYGKGAKTFYVAEWYPNDEEAQEALDFKFKVNEVDNKTN